MSVYLGIDTSNYTTSSAVYNSEAKSIVGSRLLLPVREGELGLRQSDALFHHTKQLPTVIRELGLGSFEKISAVGVSEKPRSEDGSYMPCFLAGVCAAEIISSVSSVPVYKASHQLGHILSALYSSGMLWLIEREKRFLAFHVSGGTTDCLLAEPDRDDILKISRLSASLDLKAGQLVDRVGLMLGLSFPCGKELESLAAASSKSFSPKPFSRDGSISFSGAENICKRMLGDGEPYCDIAGFCLSYIEAAIYKMTEHALNSLGDSSLPVIYAGGVMSDRLIRKRLSENFDAHFSEPEFSCDNAAGVALFAAIKRGERL